MKTKTTPKTAAKKSVAGIKLPKLPKVPMDPKHYGSWLAVGKTLGKTISIRSESKAFARVIAMFVTLDGVRVTKITPQQQLELALLGGVPVFDQEAFEAGLNPII